MAICTVAEVKLDARIDGSEFDTAIANYIAAAQSMIEHECGVAAGDFATAPDAAAKQCAIAISVQLVNNPAATRDDMRALLGSSLLDAARTWA